MCRAGYKAQPIKINALVQNWNAAKLQLNIVIKRVIHMRVYNQMQSYSLNAKIKGSHNDI